MIKDNSGTVGGEAKKEFLEEFRGYPLAEDNKIQVIPKVHDAIRWTVNNDNRAHVVVC